MTAHEIGVTIGTGCIIIGRAIIVAAAIKFLMM